MTAQIQTVSAKDLSHYILSFIPSNQLKLQKLVYYCDAWHLVFLKTPLIKEDFEAWVHGPAVRTLWQYYKEFGHSFKTMSIIASSIDAIRSKFESRVTPEQLEIIADVLDEYGDKSSYHLESLTHSEEPWIEARRGLTASERSDVIISRETMRKYYRNLLPVLNES